MKKILISLLTIIFSFNFALSMDMIDTSIDSEIRKKYNVDDISLPPLPKIYSSDECSETKTDTIKKQEPVKITPEPVKTTKPTIANVQEPFAVLKKGKKLKLRSLSQISDKTSTGTKVSFILLYPVSTTYMTIPANTILYGKVTDHHSPQITGNGGLIKIRLTSIKINGNIYDLDAKVTKAESKHIYFSKIKGKRTYLSSLPKTMKWGRNYKNKMYKMTKNFAKDGATMIFCPFSAIFGTVGYIGNLVLSPVMAIKYKGNSITLKKGSVFVFKLTEDLVIY